MLPPFQFGGPSDTVSVSTSTNRITGMSSYTFYGVYPEPSTKWPRGNSNGNLTQDDLYKYKYDAENRMVEIKLLNDTAVVTYAFDGHSLRVIKVVGGSRTWHIYAGTELVAEYDDAASATYSSGTNPGGAGSDSTSTILYQHSDHLTTRLTTENSGGLSNEQAHYPFGESWYEDGGANPSVPRKFTSYMKDGEAATGKLNYALFRQHSGRIGRFHMADPVRGRVSNPQRLNRYAYVRNNPTNRTDRRGLEDAPGFGSPDHMYEMDGGIMPGEYSGFYFGNRPAGYASDPNYQDAPWATGASWWADPSIMACSGWGVNAGPCLTESSGTTTNNWLDEPEPREKRCEREYQECRNRPPSTAGYETCKKKAEEWFGDCVTACASDAADRNPVLQWINYENCRRNVCNLGRQQKLDHCAIVSSPGASTDCLMKKQLCLQGF